jgi:hypothetical protein
MGAQPKGAKLWRGGIAPYEINQDLGNIIPIKAAITIVEEQTNLRFVGRFLQEDFIQFSKQTKGPANSEVGRQGGGQFLNASLNDVGTLLHEIAHAVGLMHEHQREDRDDFVIFHPDRVTGDPGDYEIQDTQLATEKYDFESLMHYPAGENDTPVFESPTGIPPPDKIGTRGSLTVTDKLILEALYPSAPIIRRTDGAGGAGPVLQTSAVCVSSVNSTAIVANAIRNASEKYQLVLWRIRENGVVLRMPDPVGATGGKASSVQIVQVGRLFVSAMRNAEGKLFLISHKSTSFDRLKDSANQAGKVRAFSLVALSDSRVLTVCISAAGRLLNIVWEIQTDGSIIRRFDNGTDGPRVGSVATVLFQTTGSNQLVAIVSADEASKLLLGTWRIDANSVQFVAASGKQIGAGDSAHVIATASGHVVVVCRDGNHKLLIIPFAIANDGTAISRVAGGEAKAGKIREVASIARPYGLLTSVISRDGRVLLIKWRVESDGTVTRLGESGTQAGVGSAICVVALPFTESATICTVVRNGIGNLLPITWDDVDGPGELSVV